jgi:hypothetical protein
MKFTIAAVAALCLSALVPLSASATQYLSKIDQVPGAPVSIEGCVTQVGDTMVSVPEFTNTSQQTIDAVQFKIDFYDAFDASLGSEEVQKAGTFSPGVQIRVKRLFGIPLEYDCLYPASNAVKTTCSVDKVRYADGTLWTPS